MRSFLNKFKFRKLNNTEIASTIVIALVIVLSLIYLFRNPEETEAAWWNDSWSYRQAISISNSGSTQNNVQFKVLSNADLSSLVSAGKLQSDLDDLRFTDSFGQILNYWIEDSANSSIDIWAVIDYVLADGATVYMYYGNSSSLAASNGSSIQQSGGTVSTTTGYRIHKFTSNGTFTTSSNITAETLVVAAGGGGASSATSSGGGGGGAGGLQYNATTTLESGSFVATIGAGGTAGTQGVHTSGTSGDDSSLGIIIATGGGGGGKAATNGADGGSGGGGGYNYYSTVRYGGTGTAGQGNDGGDTSDLSWAGGAGGGGASAVGQDNQPSHVGGAGGAGLSYDISGSSVTYSEGGAGGSNSPGSTTPNTGNGGDAAYAANVAYDGADGIIIVKYVASTVLTPGSPASEENAPGPIGAWHFNEGAGSIAYDATGYGNDGTINNATWAQEGKQGKALSFDGSGDYVNFGSDEIFDVGTKDFSVSVWFKMDDASLNTAIIGKGKGLAGEPYTNAGWALSYYQGNQLLYFDTYDDSARSAITSNSVIAIDTWNHVVITRSGTTGKIYLNGKLDKTGTTRTTINDASNDLKIGENSGGSYDHDGMIDEVAIYDTELSLTEVKELYNQGSASFNMGRSGIPESCSDQLANNSNSGDGIYTIDPIGSDPMDVYCDMTTSGGGWTLVSRIYDSDSDFLYDDVEWNTTGTEFGSAIADGNDYRSLAFGYLDKTQLMICDDDTYGCNIDTDFSVAETFSETITNSPEGKTAVALTKTMETYNWSTNYCQYFWNSSTYRVNLEDNDGTPKTRLVSTVSSDGVGGIGNTSGNMHIYNGTCGGDDTDIPAYVELYVRNTSLTASQGASLDMSFDNISGSTVYDTSGNGNDGTVTGATEKSATYCKVGRCYQFDGSSDYITVAHDSTVGPTTTLTASAWFKTSDKSVNSRIISKTQAGAFSISLNEDSACTASTLCFAMYVSGDAYYTAEYAVSLLNNDQWYHVAVTYDGTDLKLYLDGMLVDTTTQAGTIGTSGAPVCIGSEAGASDCTAGNYFVGYIDEVKIFDRALTQREISMEMGSSGHQPVLDMNFNEGSGSIAYDISGKGNNGTLYSVASWVDADDCISGQCVYLDGTDSTWNTVRVAEDDSLDVFGTLTVELWAKITDSRTHQVIYKRHGGGDPSWASYRVNFNSSDKPEFAVYNTSGSSATAIADSAASLNTWYHIVGVYNGSNVYIYVDGLSADSTPPSLTGDILDSDSWLQVGGLDGSQMMKGYIDELKIYPYVLAANEVQEHYIKSKGQFGQSNSAGSVSTPVAGGALLDQDLDQFSTNYKDRSGNDFDCSNSGDPVWKSSVNCKSGRCVEFDGSDYLNCGDVVANGEVTVTTWFNSTYTDQQGLFDFVGSNGNRGSFTFDYNGNESPLLYLGDTNYRYWADTSSYMDGNWHFLVLYLPGSGDADISSTTLYIDMKPITVSSTQTSSSQTTWDDFYIGRGYSNANFQGKIDQFRIYNSSLTQSEIAELYNGGAPIGWWRLDEGADNLCSDGADACDSSGEGSNATMVTSPTWTTDTSLCIQGGCMTFDGDGDNVNSSSYTYSFQDELTLTGWFKQSGAGVGSPRILEISKIGDADSHALAIDTDGSIRAWAECNTDSRVASADDATTYDSNWHFLAYTYDSPTGTIYVDGVATATASDSCSDLDDGPYLIIGAISDVSAQYASSEHEFDGKIDDARVYNYALTADQIKEVYNGGLVNFK